MQGVATKRSRANKENHDDHDGQGASDVMDTSNSKENSGSEPLSANKTKGLDTEESQCMSFEFSIYHVIIIIILLY